VILLINYYIKLLTEFVISEPITTAQTNLRG